MPQLQTTFRSTVNTWQCDENDHLNVQFFTAFSDDASIQLLSLLGLGPAAQAASGLTLEPRSDHIRYWKELRGEDAVEILSAPIAVEPDRVVLYHELRNGFDNSLSASCIRTFTSRAALPAAFVERARTAMAELPEHGRPRSAGRFGDLRTLALDQALAAGMREINRCVVAPEECDATGNLRPRFHFSRFSDGAGLLWHGLGFDRIAMRAKHQGTVVLETRTVYRRPIRVGTPTAVISGLLDHTDKALHIAHLLFNVESGELMATGEAVGVLFDQQARRSMALSQADRARMAGRVIKELRG
jgi:acyl-CoA thioester hydrolase